jgi:hypothetical protein
MCTGPIVSLPESWMPWPKVNMRSGGSKMGVWRSADVPAVVRAHRSKYMDLPGEDNFTNCLRKE